MNTVDPLAGKIGESGRGSLSRASHSVSKRPIWLGDAAAPQTRFATDNPAHRRIVAKTLSIVHILVSGEATEHRLTQQPDQCVATISARAGVGQNIARQRRQAERVIEFAIGKQTSIGGHDRTAKLQHQAAVKIEPECPIVRFTRRVRHDGSLNARISY